MGASSQGGQMNPQGAQIRPQGQQQRPMGGQGKGPGLPMPQQPQMGGNRPYQPVGANNGPFNPNPVQPVNQPPQMPAQGKAPGQLPPGGGNPAMAPQQGSEMAPHVLAAIEEFRKMNMGQPPSGGYPMQPQVPAQGGKGNMSLPPGVQMPRGYPAQQPQVMPMPPGGGYPMPPQRPFVGQGNDTPMQPLYRGSDSFGNMPPNQGKGPM